MCVPSAPFFCLTASHQASFTADELKAQVKALTEELSQAYAAAEQAAAAVHASYRRELVPMRQETALVIWKPRHRRR